VELILDALQHAGVLDDDRYVFAHKASKVVDHDLRGVLLHLYPTDEEWQAKDAYRQLNWLLNG
jgi:Holliday junction resolvase RusA-like endonuclease